MSERLRVGEAIDIKYKVYGNAAPPKAYISHVDARARMPSSEENDMLLELRDDNDVLVSARLPRSDRLSQAEQQQQKYLAREGERLRATTARGKKRTGWSYNFVGMALTVGNDSRISMPHMDSGATEGDEFSYVQFYEKLR